ncbi:aquaporin-like protein [Fimicolochytrium jonesii]|uniref:aquaporin-like protein n=1 Tax=Fimicolochytrium jonesii TaxID=1396493 RepID=UPI0022FE5964|nr:aquaporin-like protein [Fimicolochytrium jonesii]KAI8823542.1 aquaporin-like protein [Fimicolochytrium jonesii]
MSEYETQKLSNLGPSSPSRGMASQGLGQDYSVDIERRGLTSVLPDDDEIAPFDDLNDPPGKFSWNPMDWVKEFQQDYKEFSWAMTEKRRVLLRAVFGEGLCTFLFLFIVEAVTVNNGRQENPENLTLGAVSTAFCSIALIYSFADVSGAHFNPAVTFATMVTGKVSIRKGLAFIGIQLIASIFSVVALLIVFPGPHAGYSSIPASIVVDIDSTAHLGQAFAMELALTFILVYVIFATAFDTVDTSNAVKVKAKGAGQKDESVGRNLTIYTTSGNTKAGFAPFAIGFTLGFLGLIGGTVSGGAFNPARAFGPALLSGKWSNHWVYWFGDFIGAGLAGWAQHFFAHEATQTSADQKTKKGAERERAEQAAV